MGLDNKKDNRMLSRGGYSHFLVATLSLSLFIHIFIDSKHKQHRVPIIIIIDQTMPFHPSTHPLPGKGLGISPEADDSSVSVIKRKNNVIRLNAQHGLMVFVARPRNVTLAPLAIRERGSAPSNNPICGGTQERVTAAYSGVTSPR